MEIVTQQHEGLVIDQEEEYFFAHGELLKIIGKDDAELYQNYVENNFDLTNYKISPFYNNGEINAEAVFNNGSLRWKRSISEVWFYSLNLNHLYASLTDPVDGFGKSGEREFFNQAKNYTGLAKSKIINLMRISQVYTLKQAMELQSSGCQITSVLRLAAPETPREAIQMALEEANENGTTLTTEVVADIIDFSKNGIKSDFDPKQIENIEESENTENVVEIDLLANGKGKYSVMAGDDHLGMVSKVSDGVWMIEGSNGEPAFKSENDAAKRLAEINYSAIDVQVQTDDGKDEKIKQLKAERAKLLEQLEQLKAEKVEPKNDEIVIPKGSILIPESQAKVLKKWVEYWGNKYGADTPRGGGLALALNELKGFIPELSDIEIPQLKTKKSK